MDDLTRIKDQALDVIQGGGPCTIVDLWDAGLERGKPLHEALRSLEANGQITNRLERAADPHRVYSAR